MARPKGSPEQLAEIRENALEMHRAGATVSEIAARLDRTETAVRQWIRDEDERDYPFEPLREKVRARLQEEKSAALLTNNQYRVWTTDALPWAFGPSFHPGVTGDEYDDVSLDVLVGLVAKWDCYQDEQGVWRAR